jgi:hypothetical protein
MDANAGLNGFVALVRRTPTDVFALLPPRITNGRGWIEAELNSDDSEEALARITQTISLDSRPDRPA